MAKSDQAGGTGAESIRGEAAPRGTDFDRDVDVVVVGGGPAGFAASLSSADLGARTLLLEAGPELGGNATGAFVHTICGLYPAEAWGPADFLNPGLPRRFTAALMRAGAAGAVETVGKVRVVPTDPAKISRLMMAECAERASLETWTGARLAGEVVVDPRQRKNALSVESLPSGAATRARSRVSCDIVIDCTGGAVAARSAGAAVADPEESERQLPSYIVRLGGVPASDTEGYGRLRWTSGVARAANRGELPQRAESALLRPVPGSTEALLTLNLPRELVAETNGADGALEQVAAAAIEDIVAHLQAHRDGYADCRVVAWPRHAGRREGARLLGAHVIDAADILGGRRSDDEVALSSWPIELWQDHRRATYRHPEGPCGIPLGALVSRSHPRLGAAGRCLSADREALGALRVIGTALATGEALGIAAALAADTGRALDAVAASEVRAARDAWSGR